MTSKSNKWSCDFGLYRHKSPEKRSVYNRLLVGAVVVSVCVIAAFILAHFVTYDDQTTETLYVEDLPIPTNETADAEKLTKRKRQNPSPFITKLTGPPPKEFTPETHYTPVNYAQLAQYRHPNFPRNIQEILKYMGNSRMNAENDFINRYRQSQVHPKFEKFRKGMRKNSTRGEDPFYTYKPQDPGDINLLATASVRFAPPAWLNLRNGGQKIVAHESVKKETREKPLEVTLNVFPVVENSSESTPEAEPEQTLRPSRMVIHLNLFPEPMIPIFDDLMRKKFTQSD